MDYTLLLIIGVPVAVGYFLYVGIIKKKNNALNALSGIDVQLKQRSNLIPNLLKMASKFMEHEKSLLTEITALREGVEKDYDKTNPDEVKQHLDMANKLAGRMGQFMVSVENYPDLKSDQTMIQAMQSYNEVEAMIAAARRTYNAAVTDLNNSVQIFPGSVIAKMINVSSMAFYEADEASKAPVNADDYLK